MEDETRIKINQVKEAMEKGRKFLAIEKRKIELMRAGLEVRPLDRDFFEAQETDYLRKQEELSFFSTIIKNLEGPIQ